MAARRIAGALGTKVMGLSATQPVPNLRPDQFFCIGVWIGFTAMYLAGQAYLVQP